MNDQSVALRSTRPGSDEAAEYYAGYISQVPDGDVLATLQDGLERLPDLLGRLSEERSLHRYAEGKWSAREVLAHINDCERLFAFRAFWFARGFDSPLPGFDQEVANQFAAADGRSWGSHVAEFRDIRTATLDLLGTLPSSAWMRRGVASEVPFTVRALAWIMAGHAAHHVRVLQERYA